MAYTKQTWTNGTSKLNATRMQYIEDGLEAAANVADAAVAKSLVDAKGDLFVGSAADTVARQAVGANNTLVVADSAQTNGIKWALLTNSMVDAAAAIAYSKLNLASSIVNADISASAAIALSKLSGYPSDSTKFARGDGTWAAASGALTKDNTDTSVNNTTTETTLYTYSLAGGSLGSNGALRVTIVGEFSSGNNGSLKIVLKYGATTMCTAWLPGGASSTGIRPALVQFLLVANAATNSQRASVQGFSGYSSISDSGATPVSGTEDSTAAKNVVVTAQWTVANASNTWASRHMTIELL